MSLVTKLMLALIVVVVVVAVFSGIFTYKAEEQKFLKVVTLGADQLSRGITSATWHAMLADRREDAYQVMQTIAAKQGIDLIRMFNREGRITFSTRASDLSLRTGRDNAPCNGCHHSAGARHGGLESLIRVVDRPQGGRSLAIATPIPNEPSCSEAACHAHPGSSKVLGLLEVDLNLEAADVELANIQTRVLIRVIVEILLICLLVYVFVNRFINAPIQKLIESTHAISAMELEKPVAVPQNSGEITELAESFDQMRVRLRGALEEINQFTQKLESKVEERTQELQQAYRKLQHNERLASLGQLSASVAHEINNPIAGVLNLGMLMQRILKDDGIPPERLPDFRRYLGQVVGETQRVGRIVGDLLAFSRRSTPHRAQTDLNEIIRSTVSLVSHKLKLGNVAVSERYAETLPAVLCDRSQIQQVILNLVMNASEAMQAKRGGTLEIETRPAPAGDGVLVRVTDTGEGIARENLPKIFDPFFTTKPEGKGVGLGLAVSYGIVQAHGGEIEVRSIPGEGTTFLVTLPAGGASKKGEDQVLVA